MSISTPTAIDREADIPREVIDGLGRVGVLGMTAPEEVGGRGFSQMMYCKVLEEIGAPLRFDFGFHQCASLDRDPRSAPFRNQGAEGKVAAETDGWRPARGLCADRSAGRL